MAAVTFQKASFTFLKLCIDRVDVSYTFLWGDFPQ